MINIGERTYVDLSLNIVDMKSAALGYYHFLTHAII